MRDALLALLAKEPAHGYELKQAVEAEFGALWPPVNVGQIYKTLGRLEADALVRSANVAQASRPDKRVFELTAAGQQALRAWIDAPAPAVRAKDEFFTKLVLAARAQVADPLELIDRHRQALLRQLRSVNELAGTASGMTARLAVEGAVLHLQADLNWLDRCEQAFTTGEVAALGPGADVPNDARTV
jgi:DNA-binding PadR family transcriptional regulator